ncbi:MAG: hypothetical protein ACR2OU_10350 [Thermomicrobiales bacterium]
MSSLVVNFIIGFWLILFGALALFPLMLSDKHAPSVSSANKEDRVISIRPAIAEGAGRPRILPQPTSIAADRDERDHDDHPLHAA